MLMIKKGRIIGPDTVGKCLNLMIKDVLLVESIKYNLLSIIDLCDKGNEVKFDLTVCKVVKIENNQTCFTSLRSGNT